MKTSRLRPEIEHRLLGYTKEVRSVSKSGEVDGESAAIRHDLTRLEQRPEPKTGTEAVRQVLDFNYARRSADYLRNRPGKKRRCGRRDSNPHPLRDKILSLACLPIPPRPLGRLPMPGNSNPTKSTAMLRLAARGYLSIMPGVGPSDKAAVCSIPEESNAGRPWAQNHPSGSARFCRSPVRSAYAQ